VFVAYAKQERFLAEERRIRVPKRSDPNYNQAMLDLHSTILGLCALVDCFPYVVEEWIPALMEGILDKVMRRITIYLTIWQFLRGIQQIDRRSRLRYERWPLNLKRRIR
jgi:hypothetical protein